MTESAGFGSTPSESAAIERYLDDLLRELRGDPAVVRRMLRESEQHLYDAADRYARAGLEPADAARRAVADFGPAHHVARTANRAAMAASVRATVRRLAGELGPLAALGLVAVGVSGLVARLMTAIWGPTFVFADPPGTTYPAVDCRYWTSIHPHAGSCAKAYLTEAMADGLLARYVVGALGVVALCVTAFVRRRRRLPALPRIGGTPALVAAAACAVATLGLVALAVDAMRIANGNGAGQWLSGAVVAACAGACFALVHLRAAPTAGRVIEPVAGRPGTT